MRLLVAKPREDEDAIGLDSSLNNLSIDDKRIDIKLESDISKLSLREGNDHDNNDEESDEDHNQETSSSEVFDAAAEDKKADTKDDKDTVVPKERHHIVAEVKTEKKDSDDKDEEKSSSDHRQISDEQGEVEDKKAKYEEEKHEKQKVDNKEAVPSGKKLLPRGLGTRLISRGPGAGLISDEQGEDEDGKARYEEEKHEKQNVDNKEAAPSGKKLLPRGLGTRLISRSPGAGLISDEQGEDKDGKAGYEEEKQKVDNKEAVPSGKKLLPRGLGTRLISRGPGNGNNFGAPTSSMPGSSSPSLSLDERLEIVKNMDDNRHPPAPEDVLNKIKGLLLPRPEIVVAENSQGNCHAAQHSWVLNQPERQVVEYMHGTAPAGVLNQPEMQVVENLQDNCHPAQYSWVLNQPERQVVENMHGTAPAGVLNKPEMQVAENLQDNCHPTQHSWVLNQPERLVSLTINRGIASFPVGTEIFMYGPNKKVLNLVVENMHGTAPAGVLNQSEMQVVENMHGNRPAAESNGVLNQRETQILQTAQHETGLQMDGARLTSSIQILDNLSDMELTTRDMQGDPPFMIVICQPRNSDGYNENMYAMTYRVRLIRMCCDIPLDRNKPIKECTRCGNTDEQSFYSPFAMHNNENHTVLSGVLTLRHSQEVVNYICAHIRQNPSDVRRIFRRQTARFYREQGQLYPILNEFVPNM